MVKKVSKIMDAEIKYAKINGIEIAYKIYGQGYPLILIMGLGGTMDLWDKRVIEKLASKYKVIIFDNRGMGSSSSSNEEFTILQMAKDVAGLVDALEIKEAHILGWSMGTYIVQELALNYPSKIKKMILYGAGCAKAEAVVMKSLADILNSPEKRAIKILRVIKIIFTLTWLLKHPDFRKYLPHIKKISSEENIRRQFNAINKWEGVCDKLSQIKNPVLLIIGTKDVLTPIKNSQFMLERLGNSQLVKIEGGGHGAMYQYAEKFSQEVIEFLEK